VCADGGANRLKDLDLNGDEEMRCVCLCSRYCNFLLVNRTKGLSMICGDFDSIHPEVLQHYEKKGVVIIQDTDQYSTDLMKCLKCIRTSHKFLTAKDGHSHEFEDPMDERVDVAIFGGLGGRADQAFSQLHHLYDLAGHRQLSWTGDTFLVTAESLIFLLEKGLNRIHAPVRRQGFTENVGIVPIGRPSIITTHGFEWDVTDWPTEFGTQISTSNHIKADVVEVESTEKVLFMLEFDQGSWEDINYLMPHLQDRLI